MSVAPKIEFHLSRTGVEYDLINHPKSSTSLESARTANIPSHQLAKAVITHNGENYRLCVIPANHRLVSSWLDEHLGKHYSLVKESEMDQLFEDCEVGAIPALGQVYGLPVTWDASLQDKSDIYFESGDHRNLIHVSHGAFMQLMGLQDKETISCANDEFEDESHLLLR